jgi:hypothetical protein
MAPAQGSPATGALSRDWARADLLPPHVPEGERSVWVQADPDAEAIAAQRHAVEDAGRKTRRKAPRSGALDLHEEISHPGAAGGCERWPESLRLLSSTGELVRGRCGSANQCSYCAKLGAVENVELLTLDAMHGEAPRFLTVLTTSKPIHEASHFYKARELVLRAVRRRWPSAEVATILEFSTGYAEHAGGKRRPHWNLFIKGVNERREQDGRMQTEDELVAELREVIVGVWCSREDVGADPKAQYCRPIREVGGLTRYLAMHFHKEEQAPPRGWRGHRFRASRGYLWLPTPEAREAARDSLRLKRELWRQLKRDDDDAPATAYDAELKAQEALALAKATTWRMTNVARPGRDPGLIDAPPLEDGASMGGRPCDRCATLDGPCSVHLAHRPALAPGLDNLAEPGGRLLSDFDGASDAVDPPYARSTVLAASAARGALDDA